MRKIQDLYDMFVRAASILESPFLLIVRLYWGWQMAQAGWVKLGSLGKVTDYFASLGIPAPALNAYFISGLEFFGASCSPSDCVRRRKEGEQRVMIAQPNLPPPRRSCS